MLKQKKYIYGLTLSTALIGGLLNHPAMANPPPSLEMGFGFYVGGLHIIDAKTTFSPTNNNTQYNFTAVASTRGITDWIAGFIGISTSHGILNPNGSVKAIKHTNTSSSNFGENYSELILTKSGAKLVRYPDRNEENLKNLKGNPLVKANDPVATLLNIMVQVSDTKRCAKDLIVVANHFLYRMKTLKARTLQLDETDYNIAKGKVIACDLDFVRLDNEDNLSAYNDMKSGGDGKNRPPVAYFKNFKSIPYALPVLISAKEENFGEFRMHLQYVKYGDIIYKIPAWNNDETFTTEKLKVLKSIPKKLGAD